jgi:hypothetical protein
MTKLQKINAIADKITHVLKDHREAKKDDRALFSLRDAQIDLQEIDPYAGSLANSLLGFAKDYYTVRKHQKFRGGSEALYRRMLADVGRIRTHAARSNLIDNEP